MEGEQPEPPERRARDYRYYTENAYQVTDVEGYESHQLDVDDLVGARGTKLEPHDENWRTWRELGQTSNLEPNALITDAAIDDIEAGDDPDNDIWHEGGAINILRLLSRRLGPLAAEPFTTAIHQMMEPVRAVAFNCLIHENSHEAVAQRLGTSVETVDFLVEIALSHLETLVEFRSPRVRPPSAFTDPSDWHPLLDEDE